MVMARIPSLNEKQARKVVGGWSTNGQLYSREYYDEHDHKDRQGLYVNAGKRPGAAR